MRQTIAHLIFAATAMTSLGGCAPAKFTSVPEFRGRVVDQSHAPVPGATVNITTIKGFAGHLDATMTCDASGVFVRNEEAAWGLFIVGMDPFGSRYEVIARKDDQRSAAREFSYPWRKVRVFGLGSPDVIDLGDLQIENGVVSP